VLLEEAQQVRRVLNLLHGVNQVGGQYLELTRANPHLVPGDGRRGRVRKRDGGSCAIVSQFEDEAEGLTEITY
jgi:hypothetical protein